MRGRTWAGIAYGWIGAMGGARKSPVTYRFVASSGHELDGAGLREFIRAGTSAGMKTCLLAAPGRGYRDLRLRTNGRRPEETRAAFLRCESYTRCERFVPALKDSSSRIFRISSRCHGPAPGEMI